jgi:Holliday junction resolvase-like predicted endonuclease
MFAVNVEAGKSIMEAAALVAHAYLDGKPRQHGKRKLTRAALDAAFWSSDYLASLPDEVWHTEPLTLALARYMAQEQVSNLELLQHISVKSPESVRRAIRYSGLVLKQHSLRRQEINCLAAAAPTEFGDIVSNLAAFDIAHSDRLEAVASLKRTMTGLSPLEFLSYVSLYAFEYLVPGHFATDSQPVGQVPDMQAEWEAINDLLIDQLRSAKAGAFHLTEQDIAKSLATHLSPFLFPSEEGPPSREDLYLALKELVAAQVELNDFIARAADAFSYDDCVDYVLKNSRLEIVERDPAGRAAWARNGEKLSQLHAYWMFRGMGAFAASDKATLLFGTVENHEANRFAYIKAMRTYLRLTEVYGLSDSVITESGLSVDIFQALLASELMSAFFQIEFLQPYMQHLRGTGNARMALGLLALGEFAQESPQIRLPITWSEREEKINMIKNWTVSKEMPRGSLLAAEAILDFWTSDWGSLSERLSKGASGLNPTLYERPFIKIGRYLFQLPWVVGHQNNSSAAINNLRRIGSRRDEARAETQQVEASLARLFEARGFSVSLNYCPERTQEPDPGEVDLICTRDDSVLVIEVKSTFLRHSLRSAWMHRTNTLRKAGLQLAHKIHAVERALDTDHELLETLGMNREVGSRSVIGWIVDTSIEFDHERFGGFLKVSLEEILIALRDDSHLLGDPGEYPTDTPVGKSGDSNERDGSYTLYPAGFSFSNFVSVIESGAIWVDAR